MAAAGQCDMVREFVRYSGRFFSMCARGFQNLVRIIGSWVDPDASGGRRIGCVGICSERGLVLVSHLGIEVLGLGRIPCAYLVCFDP